MVVSGIDVPRANLHGDKPVINLNFLRQKIGANGRLVLVRELLIDISARSEERIGRPYVMRAHVTADHRE